MTAVPRTLRSLSNPARPGRRRVSRATPSWWKQPKGSRRADFLICGTGIEMDFARRPELVRIAGDIATWADRYTPPPEERDQRLAKFPYLGRTSPCCRGCPA